MGANRKGPHQSAAHNTASDAFNAACYEAEDFIKLALSALVDHRWNALHGALMAAQRALRIAGDLAELAEAEVPTAE